MRVTELDAAGYPQCILGEPTESNGKRSQDKLHLSEIYRDMEESAFLAKRRDASPEELAWYGAGGFLWERAFSQAYRDAIVRGDLVRTDEWQCDGIVGSPDAIDVPNWRVVELKFRWMSSNKFDHLEKYFWLELVQVKGYCKMVGTEEAELWVFFCNGDYRPPVPVVKGVLLEFSQQEIEESWQMIKSHAHRRGWL